LYTFLSDCRSRSDHPASPGARFLRNRLPNRVASRWCPGHGV